MIKLTRIRSAEAIPEKYRGEKRIDKALALMVAPNEKREFDSSYWTAAKDQLRREAGGKCAYCEASVAETGHGDIEHFRPKSVYWRFAYCYDNYLFACQICNQTYKGDHFPIDGTPFPAPVYSFHHLDVAQQREQARRFAPDPLDSAAGMDWGLFEAQKSLEAARLVNPYEEDPETLYEWEEVSPGEIHVKAVAGYARAERAFEASQKYLGLNRETLRRDRYEQYKMIACAYTLYESATPASPKQQIAEAILKVAVSGERRYTGMCRYFIRKVWGLPF